MKVFLSWSGDRSRRTASVLRDWLPQVLQAVSPWMSEEDIEKGSRSTTEIKLALEDASFGIVCVTRENVAAPWLNFEAGALSKEVADARVYVAPFLLDMTPEEIRGPLTDFQVTRNTEADVRRMMATLNSQLASPLGDGLFDRAFQMWWPELDKALAQVLAETEDAPSRPPLTTDEMLTEILANVRHTRRVESASAVAPAVNKDQKSMNDAILRRERLIRARRSMELLLSSLDVDYSLQEKPPFTLNITVNGAIEDFPLELRESLTRLSADTGVAGEIRFTDSPNEGVFLPPF